MSKFFDLTFGQFLKVGPKNPNTNQHPLEDVFIMKTPLWSSMSRFRDKLLYNCLNQTFKPNFLVTLTVDEQHYDEMCKARSLSKGVRIFWNNLKSYGRNHGLGVKYAWRIERGEKSTKRLHIHSLVQIDRPLLSKIEKYWSFCDWGKLKRDAQDKGKSGPIAEITDSAQIISYCLKYASKTYKERLTPEHQKNWLEPNHLGLTYKSESCLNTKRDLKVSRLVGTTRDIKMMPKWFWLQFDPDIQVWQPKLKDNWVWNRGNPVQKEFFVRINIEGFYGVHMQDSQKFAGYLQNHFPDFMKQLQTKENRKMWSDKFNFMVNTMNYDNLPLDKSRYEFLWKTLPNIGSTSDLPVLSIGVSSY